MNASPPPQPRQSAGWTTGLALLSLVLSGLLWITGLVDSLQRPSVGNSLELRQLELTALAAPALPAGLRQALTGAQPLEALRLDLQKQLDGNPVPAAPQQELQLALLELQAGQGSAARLRLQELNQQVPPEQRSRPCSNQHPFQPPTPPSKRRWSNYLGAGACLP